MGTGISYEIRTIASTKVTNRVFVDTPQDLYAQFETMDPQVKTRIFKILSDDTGEIISCDELLCTISGNTFVVKTLISKPRKPIRDTDAPSITFLDGADQEQVYDIAVLLKKPLKVKRVVPPNPATRQIPNRPKKTLKTAKKVLPVGPNARRSSSDLIEKKPLGAKRVLPGRPNTRTGPNRSDKTLKKEGQSPSGRKAATPISRGISNKPRPSSASRAGKSYRKN